MTALLLYAKCQVARTIHSPRRLNVMFVLMLAIAALGMALLFQAAPSAISYPQRFIAPTPGAVCPGDSFTYPVNIVVDAGDSTSKVTEGWCKVGGVCPSGLQSEPVYFNFLEAQELSVSATRTVPAALTPGDWQLRHCNETHRADGTSSVVCYQVSPITVKEDCAP